MNDHRQRIFALIAALAAMLLAACRPNMSEQPRHAYYDASSFFADGKAAREPVEGTIPRDLPFPDAPERTGMHPDGSFLDELPFALTAERLAAGREAFGIHCAVCHGSDGGGFGIVVRRGFPQPPSFHNVRLREAPLGYLVQVIKEGYGLMYPYGARVSIEDRWAIAAYIRSLQLSQYAELESLPAQDRAALEELTP